MIGHLARAAAPLLFDAVGVIAFAVLLALHVDLVVATLAGVIIACAIVGWQLLRGRPVAPLQWLSAVLVLIAGAATLYSGDPRFVMAKPTLIYLAIGAAMLQHGWMHRYVAPEVLPHVGGLMTRFGYAWAALMFATAIANLVVALAFTAWWPAFVATVPAGSKFALFAGQFAFVYSRGRTRIRGERAAAAGRSEAPAGADS
jgi:intracellular septation protein A